MKPRIVVVGSLNMDVVCQVARAPEAGETVLGRSASFVAGGKGANQAVAAARLGGAVTMIGRIGADEFGAQLRRGLADEGIDATHVSSVAGVSSGVALILVDAAAQNRITVMAGANAMLSPANVSAAAGVLRGAALLIVQLETPLPTVERALQEARGAGVRTLVNPAPAQQLPASWWPLIDYLVPNETEGSLLAGVPVRDAAGAGAAAAVLHARGACHVLITLGAAGVVLHDGGGRLHIPAPRVKACDTTAAGDTFIGALAVALGEGRALQAAAEFAVRAAAVSVTRHGAQTSIPHRAEVDSLPWGD